jgi:glycosyltransferase involved in cell wall biosynthesis
VDVVGGLNAEPGYAEEMRRLVNTNRLSSNVVFHGALDYQPLIDIYKQAHLMVVPSSYEGFGIVYLEGMGFGLPAIGTTAGAAGEIISDGVDGFLIQPGDSPGLANRLKVLNEKRDLLIQMSLEARQRYLRQPKWVQTAGQIREFLMKRIAEFSV